MSNINLPAVLTPDEVADYLKLDKSTVTQELHSGRLRGFKAGEEWRITETSLLDYINRGGPSQNLKSSEGSTKPYTSEAFTKIGAFEYKWPSGVENYDYGYDAAVNIGNKIHSFRIGFTYRDTAGQNRRRIVVFMDNWPLVELSAGNNYKNDKLYASVIKVGGRQVRPNEPTPTEYDGFRIDTYDSIVQGPYASKNMAIVVAEDDLASMLKHAIIRATDKKFI